MPKARSRKIKLHGFNNLTKSLSFNIYDICYAQTEEHRAEYIAYIDEVYNARRLSQTLHEVADIIGANVLAVSNQDYEPQGASVVMLISEEPVASEQMSAASFGEAPGPLPETVLGHLDKSHITVHTYPESHPEGGISTFRVDIDVSTCGRISPLRALNYLIYSFESDIVTVDYRVRGFTRDIRGKKHFIDHKINSIQNFLDKPTRQRYRMIDVNVYAEQMFHTKMLLDQFDLDNYLFGAGREAYSHAELTRIEQRLRREMTEIFYGRNVTRAG